MVDSFPYSDLRESGFRAPRVVVVIGFEAEKSAIWMKANGEGRTVVLSTAVAESDMNPPGSADARGKHRILAEMKHLEQEARFLEEEVEELKRTEKVSASLQEFLHKIESHGDPLLPITHGPANPSWDKWFEGPPDSRHCKCWIL